jgi:hypothetical protein
MKVDLVFQTLDHHGLLLADQQNTGLLCRHGKFLERMEAETGGRSEDNGRNRG